MSEARANTLEKALTGCGCARALTDREAAAWYWECEPADPIEHLGWLLVRWLADPVCFAVEALRVKLLPYQAAVLLDLADAPAAVYAFYGVDPSKPKRMVLVPSGHGLGKTRVIAIAIWWMLLTHKFSKVLVTAPTSDQITGQLWGELRKMFRRLKKSWPDLADDWEILGTSVAHKNPDYGDWHCMARTARPEKPEGLQGAHALDGDDEDGQLARLFGEDMELGARGGILVVAEEASGVDDSIREVLTGALTEDGARLLAPGNPTRPDGWFARDMDRPDVYAVHPLDCRMSSRESLYTLPYRDFGGNVHDLTARGLVKPDYWRTVLDECDGDEDRDRFRVRVRGLRPRSAFEAVVQRKWVVSALAREADPLSVTEPAVVSLDFGLTNDKHALAVRRGFDCPLIEEWLPPEVPEQITLAAADRAKDAVDTWGCRVIIGDANGVGRGAMESLHEYYSEGGAGAAKGVRVIFFNSGEVAADRKRYYRRRDEMWVKKGRAWLSDPRCSLPEHPGLTGQLCAPFYEEDASRRIKVATKQQIKKERGQDSGNAADALLQSLMVGDGLLVEAEPDEAPPPRPGVFQRHFSRLRKQARGGRYIDVR